MLREGGISTSPLAWDLLFQCSTAFWSSAPHGDWYVAGYETSGYGCFSEIDRFRPTHPTLWRPRPVRLFPIDGSRALPPCDLPVFLPQCPPWTLFISPIACNPHCED